MIPPKVGLAVRVVAGKHTGKVGVVAELLKGGWIRVRCKDGTVVSTQGRSSLEPFVASPERQPLRERSTNDRAAEELEAQRLSALKREAARVAKLREAARALRLEKERANDRDRADDRANEQPTDKERDRLRYEQFRRQQRQKNYERFRPPPPRRDDDRTRFWNADEARRQAQDRKYFDQARGWPHDKLAKALHYRILDVRPSAKTPEIKAKYKELARRHHPDKQCHDLSKATERMAKINEAFAVLRDTVSRKAYQKAFLSGKAL